MAFNVSGTLVNYLPPVNLVSDIICDGSHWIVLNAPNVSSGVVTAAALATLLSGQTMNIAGSSTSCSGNAATATTAAACSGNAATATTVSSVPVASVTGLSASLVAQTASAYTTGGTSSAFTLTPTPALAANAANVRYNVTFNQAGTGSPTLAVSLLAALPLMAYNSAGTLVTYLPAANQNSDVICDGTHWIVLDPITKGTASGGRFRNLIVTYSQSSGTVIITADEVTVSDLNGNQTRLSSIAVNAALSTVGAINGTDGSTQTAGNFYTVWVAYNPTTGAVGALISAEPTSPTTALLGPASPVSGYTQYACVSINKIKALAPAYWLPGIQANFKFSPTTGAYLTAPVLVASGSLGTWSGSVYAAQTVRGNSSSIPYHASKIKGFISSLAGAGMMLAPNNTYSGIGYANTTNPAPVNASLGGSAYEYPFEFLLESNNIYACFNGTGYIWLERWTLNL
jgi:hypothetical protein